MEDDEFEVDDSTVGGLGYSEFFDKRKTEALWQQLTVEVRELYCKVHQISVQSSLFMSLVASSFTLPSYKFA